MWMAQLPPLPPRIFGQTGPFARGASKASGLCSGGPPRTQPSPAGVGEHWETQRCNVSVVCGSFPGIPHMGCPFKGWPC